MTGVGKDGWAGIPAPLRPRGDWPNQHPPAVPIALVHRDGDIGTVGTTRESGDGASDGGLTGYSAAPLLDGYGFRA
jgi:hypothetical protein